jgi:hypothetical protein
MRGELSPELEMPNLIPEQMKIALQNLPMLVRGTMKKGEHDWRIWGKLRDSGKRLRPANLAKPGRKAATTTAENMEVIMMN